MSSEMSRNGSYAVDVYPQAQQVTSDRSRPPNTRSTMLVRASLARSGSNQGKSVMFFSMSVS